MASYDVRSAQAAQRWSQVLPEAVRQEVARLVDDAAAGATRRWRAWCAGEADEPEDPEDPTAHVRPRGSRRPGAGLVPEAGTEDPAHPASPVGAGALRLQRQLTRMMDACAARGLLERARQSGDWERELLLRELSSPDVSQEWLWRIDANKGPALSPDDYAAAVRLRLGSGGPAEAVPCACHPGSMRCSVLVVRASEATMPSGMNSSKSLSRLTPRQRLSPLGWCPPVQVCAPQMFSLASPVLRDAVQPWTWGFAAQPLQELEMTARKLCGSASWHACSLTQWNWKPVVWNTGP